MSENQTQAAPEEGFQRPTRRPKIFNRRKSCVFCGKNGPKIDYKNADLLRRHTSERGKITPRRISSVCLKHQRELAQNIKRARFLALIPYVNS